MNELIKITQLPVIEERLRTMKDEIDKAVSDANALVCTEDTIQSVKQTRTDLSKKFKELEEQRKTVKSAVLEPYERFEAVYKECVSDAFKGADVALKGKIDAVESEIKQRCTAALKVYFDELCLSNHVDFIRFEQAGVNVDLSSAKQKTPKKLREQLYAFVSDVAAGMNAILPMDNAEEIMVEFKRTLNVATSIVTVLNRHEQLEEEKERHEQRTNARKAENDSVAKVETIAPPVVVKEPVHEDKILRCQFTAFSTIEKLRKLKEFMNQEGIRYE